MERVQPALNNRGGLALYCTACQIWDIVVLILLGYCTKPGEENDAPKTWPIAFLILN